MKTKTRTWICKSTKAKPNDISTPYHAQVNAGVAGFNLVAINPSKYKDEKALQSDITVGKPTAGLLTGRTFGKQAWAISHEAKPGDRIFLECPDAGPKPRGTHKHSTFIVAAGTITDRYQYNESTQSTIGLHTIRVDWQWIGKRLINYGQFMYCFVEVLPRKKAHAKLLEALDSIWTGSHEGELQPIDHPIKKADKSKALGFDPDWREGSIKMRQHITIERCSQAATEAKNAAREYTGAISCRSCGVITSEVYGHEIIDAHHIVPLANTKGLERKPSATDFAMLCPTCHRAVHKLINLEKLDGLAAIEEARKRASKKR